MGLQSFLVNFSELTDAPSSIARLRELILQLAVEGKLVHQDEREESAFQLIKRIEAKRIQLAEEKGYKAIQAIPVGEGEFPYVVPAGWLWTRLTNLGFINPRNDFDDRATASFVPMNLIPQKYGESVKTETRYWSDIKKGFTHFAEGDVVLAKITPCFQNGKAAVMRGLENKVGAGTTELHVFRSIDGLICPDYVLAYLKSPKFLLEGSLRMTGTAGQKRVPNEYFAQNPFPLPPLEEQRRIVAKVEELMRICDELDTRQQAKRESQVRLNAAVLAPLNKAASLTPKELEQATTRLADNFDTLYDSIDTVSKLRATILHLAVQGKLACRLNENKPENGSRVSDYVKVLNGYAFKSEWFVSNGIRLLRNTNIGHGSVQWREVACIAKDRAKEFGKFALEDRDIVISLDRPLISTGLKVARISKKDLPCLLLQRVGKVQPTNNKLDLDYFFMWLHSPAFVNAIDPGRSNGVPHISTKSIESIPFSPPPVAEQKRIVAKVNQLMSLCDELEAKLRQAEADSEKLMNAAVKHVMDSVRDASKTTEEVFA